MQNTFTIKEVRKLIILSIVMSVFIFGSGGYFLGRNSSQSEFYKIMLIKEQEKSVKEQEIKKAEEKMFKSLKQSKWTIEGNEQGY